jgi:valyl-tRNA synthetase
MPLQSVYNPKNHENRIYELWQKQGVGSPENQAEVQGEQKGAYTNLMPPPNLTGTLHAGHAFGHYLMDTLTRIHRQKGENSLWLPGVDHAGIQLEGVIDKAIKAGEFVAELDGIELPNDRSEWPKFLKNHHTEKWLELAWKKANEWRGNQAQQSAILGDTPDYGRNLFTLDDASKDMVFAAFKKYYEDGLIYKKSYLINWSVGLQTALSDVPEDIGHEKRKDPFVTFEYQYFYGNGKKKGIAFKLQEYFKENSIIVSTVRPETIFADKAIAINTKVFIKSLSNYGYDIDEINEAIMFLNSPKNENHLDFFFHIKDVVDDIRLILVDDDNEVDPNFGTGALKITPAHDLADYEIFHKYLGGEFEQAVGRDGKLTEVCGEFAGLTVDEGRKKVIQKLIETGYVPEKKEFEPNPKLDKQIADYLGLGEQETIGWSKFEIDWNYEHNVTICERSKTVVEPLISEEFFLSYTNKDPKGKSLQEYGLEGVKKTTYYPNEFKRMGANYIENIKDWCISRDLVWGHKIPVWYNLEVNAEKKFESGVGMMISQEKPIIAGDWVQEEKILDTWFSSCLWPLSTLGYPDSADYKKYYPTQDMVTAREIFYAWIIRMTMLGVYFTGEIPFENVIITPTIQDEQGKKMSKSLGNGLDPVAGIEKYSSDSLRFSMLGGMIPNRNMRLGGALADRLMERYRNFGNKVWNVGRFLEMKLGESKMEDLAPLTSGSLWILGKFESLLLSLYNHTNNFELAHSVQELYSFLWDDFADWYIEYLKSDPTQIPFAMELFKQYAIILSPYLPFESQVIWEELFGKESLLVFEVFDSKWSEKYDKNQGTIEEFEDVKDLINDVRSLRGLFAIDPAVYIQLYSNSDLFERYREFLKLAGRVELVLSDEVQSYHSLKLGYSIDIMSYIKDVGAEKQRTQKTIDSLEKQIVGINAQLGNDKFMSHATQETIEEKQQQLMERSIELKQNMKKLELF